jgi:hypothetical protein
VVRFGTRLPFLLTVNPFCWLSAVPSLRWSDISHMLWLLWSHMIFSPRRLWTAADSWKSLALLWQSSSIHSSSFPQLCVFCSRIVQSLHPSPPSSSPAFLAGLLDIGRLPISLNLEGKLTAPCTSSRKFWRTCALATSTRASLILIFSSSSWTCWYGVFGHSYFSRSRYTSSSLLEKFSNENADSFLYVIVRRIASAHDTIFS